jgi:molybdopterin/thiamine biosynthesis adenylyltransferase
MIGEPKVVSAQQALLGLNPDLKITALQERLEGANLSEAVSKADLVVDACDNFTSRFAINAACIEHRKPLVSGAAIRMEGQIAVFDSRSPTSPCYQCLYSQGNDEDASCSENGVMAPLVGIIGAVQAMEAIKLLTGIGKSLTGRLLLLDASTLQWREMRLPRDSNCGACGD